MPLTTDDRLAAVEADVASIKTALNLLTTGQAEAREEVRLEGVAQRKLISDAAQVASDRLAEQTATLTTQTATILSLSTTLNAVQANIQKWAAGGALLGAVLLFIAVRALGF